MGTITQGRGDNYNQGILEIIRERRGEKGCKDTAETRFLRKKGEILAGLRVEALETPVQVVPPAQQAAVDAIAKLRVGVPFNPGVPAPTPAVEAEKPAEITKEQAEAMNRIKQLRLEQGYGTVSPETAELTEEQIQHTWRSNPAIRHEFTSYEAYRAYVRAANQGRAKIVGSKK